MVNLRPRVGDFAPFKPIQPTASPPRSTYATPDVNQDEARAAFAVAESLRGLSPELDRYLKRGVAIGHAQMESQAAELTQGMTAEQLRKASESEWDEVQRGTAVDSLWWKLKLDEAAGERIGILMQESLVSRLSEARDPSDPQAHFRIAREERAKHSAGLSSFARAKFEPYAQRAEAAFIAKAGQIRREAVDQNERQLYLDKTRNVVGQYATGELSVDDARKELMALMDGEFRRTGEEQRGQMFAIISASATARIAAARDKAELDLVAGGMTELVSQMGEWVDASGATLSEQDEDALFGLQAEIDKLREARSQSLLQEEGQHTTSLRILGTRIGVTLSEQDLDEVALDQKVAEQIEQQSPGLNETDRSYAVATAKGQYRADRAARKSATFAQVSNADKYIGLLAMVRSGFSADPDYAIRTLEAIDAMQGELSERDYLDLRKMVIDGRAVFHATAHQQAERLRPKAEDFLNGAEFSGQAEMDAATAELERMLAEEERAMADRLVALAAAKGVADPASVVADWSVTEVAQHIPAMRERAREIVRERAQPEATLRQAVRTLNGNDDRRLELLVVETWLKGLSEDEYAARALPYESGYSPMEAATPHSSLAKRLVLDAAGDAQSVWESWVDGLDFGAADAFTKEGRTSAYNEAKKRALDEFKKIPEPKPAAPAAPPAVPPAAQGKPTLRQRELTLAERIAAESELAETAEPGSEKASRERDVAAMKEEQAKLQAKADAEQERILRSTEQAVFRDIRSAVGYEWGGLTKLEGFGESGQAGRFSLAYVNQEGEIRTAARTGQFLRSARVRRVYSAEETARLDARYNEEVGRTITHYGNSLQGVLLTPDSVMAGRALVWLPDPEGERASQAESLYMAAGVADRQRGPWKAIKIDPNINPGTTILVESYADLENEALVADWLRAFPEWDAKRFADSQRALFADRVSESYRREAAWK